MNILMAKNKKKGFTLVELIVVIVIIGVLATIIVPIVTNSLSKGKEEYIDALQEEMILVAQDYYTENIVELPRGQIDNEGNKKLYSVVSIEDLEKNNFATNKFVDPNGKTCEQSFVSVTNINGNYNYNVCVICDGKIYTEDVDSCSVEAPDNPQAPITPQIPDPSCSIEISSPTDLTRTTTITAITPDSTLNGITFVNDETSASSEVTIEENIGTATVSASGAYTATVTNANGQSGTCAVTINPIPVSTYSSWTSYAPSPTCDTSNTNICRTATMYRCELDGGRAVGDGYYCCWGDCSSTNPAYASSCTGGWSSWSTTHFGSTCNGWGVRDSQTTTGYSSRTLTITYN